jgi:hypothetical protein
MRRIAYDTVLKRPGCVLLQAAMGCFETEQDSMDFELAFKSETWLVYPTPDLRVYPLDERVTLERLAAITNASR